jgi:hypothetical protein
MRTPCAVSSKSCAPPADGVILYFVTKREIREYFAKFGKKGGKATAKNLTPEQRKASARKAAKARWAKAKKTGI